MNILVVSQYYYPEPFRLHEICIELYHRGHNVTVLTGIPNYPDGEVYASYTSVDCEEHIDGVTVIRCASRPRHKGNINLLLNYLSFYYASRKRLNKLPNTFDIVYSYQLSPVTSSKPAIEYARRNKIPVLLYCLDIWPESIVGEISKSNLLFKVVKNISSTIYNGCDKILVTSPSFINYLHNICNVKKSILKYHPQHSCDVMPIENIAHKGINFVFMGNVGISQNLQCFVRACSLIKNRMGIKIHIVGSGAYLEDLKIMVEKEKVNDSFVFHGRKPMSDMPKYYGIADVCIVSLRDEGAVSSTIPGKVQEYMSAGKPILAAIDGDTKLIINEAKCGRVVNYNDVNSIASAILELSNNPSILKEMGQNARKYYEEHFTLKKHIDNLESEMETLVKL